MAAILWIEVSAYQDNKLYLYFLDVGQGDAIYIRTPDRQDVVIDGGPDNAVLAELGERMPFYDRKIELLILTHPHEDHINGLIEIVNRYEIDKILMPELEYDSAAFYQLQKSINDLKIPVFFAHEKQEVKMGAIRLQIYNPEINIDNIDNINNISVVAKLSYGKSAALLTGDAEEIVEKRIINKYPDELKADLIKIGHHGSNTSSSEKFIDNIDPSIAIISAGEGNKYNHPSSETLTKLKKRQISFFRTDYQGNISCVSDSIKFNCQAEKF